MYMHHHYHQANARTYIFDSFYYCFSSFWNIFWIGLEWFDDNDRLILFLEKVWNWIDLHTSIAAGRGVRFNAKLIYLSPRCTPERKWAIQKCNY